MVNICNLNTLWEIIKSTIRNETIKYATQRKKNKLEREVQLVGEIDRLESKINTTSNTNENYIASLNRLKQELDFFHTEKINGCIIRANVQHIENNETNSKHFANLEKRHFEQKTIHTLKTDNKEITSKDEMLKEQQLFYQGLYRKRNNMDSEIQVFDTPLPILNNVDKNSCEGVLAEY